MKANGVVAGFALIAIIGVFVALLAPIFALLSLVALLRTSDELHTLFVGFAILVFAGLYLTSHPLFAFSFAVLAAIPIWISQMDWHQPKNQKTA